MIGLSTVTAIPLGLKDQQIYLYPTHNFLGSPQRQKVISYPLDENPHLLEELTSLKPEGSSYPVIVGLLDEEGRFVAISRADCMKLTSQQMLWVEQSRAMYL